MRKTVARVEQFETGRLFPLETRVGLPLGIVTALIVLVVLLGNLAIVLVGFVPNAWQLAVLRVGPPVGSVLGAVCTAFTVHRWSLILRRRHKFNLREEVTDQVLNLPDDAQGAPGALRHVGARIPTPRFAPVVVPGVLLVASVAATVGTIGPDPVRFAPAAHPSAVAHTSILAHPTPVPTLAPPHMLADVALHGSGASSGYSIGSMTHGSDGSLWFADFSANAIGRVGADGTVTTFPLPTPNSGISSIAAGPDGNVWFTESSTNRIGRITPTGAIAEFPIPTPNSDPAGLISGPNGSLWFVELGPAQIGSITRAGAVKEFAMPASVSGNNIGALAGGKDGNLYFFSGNSIGKLTPSGAVTLIPLPSSVQGGIDVMVGAPDGSLWLGASNSQGGLLLRMTPAGQFTTFQVPGPPPPTSPGGRGGPGQPIPVVPTALIVGPDGDIWFIQSTNGVVGRITPAGTFTTLTLPNSVTFANVYVAVGPDGNVWFDEAGAGGVVTSFGRVAP